VSLVSPDEAPLLRDIERLLKRPLQVSVVPQFPINMALGPVTDRGPSADPRRANSAARPSRPQGQRRDGGGRTGRGRGSSASSHQGQGARQRMH
jgi:ATP-dependent RNA helicase RhlE